MTTYYVGSGGNDGNAGTSWALRKLTLNGAEDIPVAAGDTVYVGPGVYRETLTCDIDGSAGNYITYIGDYTGANTDGTGGEVRISASDNDQTVNRNNCIENNSRDYRVFRGFTIHAPNQDGIVLTSCVYNVIDECIFLHADTAQSHIYVQGSGSGNNTIQNCWFFQLRQGQGIYFVESSTLDDSAHVVQNCVALGSHNQYVFRTLRVGGITVKNCTIIGGSVGVYSTDLAAGQTTTVNNCILTQCNTGLSAGAAGMITEDYNNLYQNGGDRTNTATGGNSIAYLPSFETRWFHEATNGGTLITPWDLASYSQLINVAGTSPTSTDLRGASAVGGTREWGALEYDSSYGIEAGSGGNVNLLAGKVGR